MKRDAGVAAGSRLRKRGTCSATTAGAAAGESPAVVQALLASLLAGCRARHVFLSYSSEGLLTAGEVQRLMARHGSVTRRDYRCLVFGRGAGLARKRW